MVLSDQDIPVAIRGLQTARDSGRGSSVSGTPRWLGPFFCLVARMPWLVRAFRPVAVRVVLLFSSTVRCGTRANATHIFGRILSRREQRAFTRHVVGSFYDFIADIGQFSRRDSSVIISRIERFEGEDAYRATRASGNGAVLVTAHMGSLEVGLAALANLEDRIHVVFKRDNSGPFESMRTAFRKSLGVIESPIEEGLSMWLGLRQALGRGEVVVMQIDRAMLDQAAVTVDLLHGRLRMPIGGVWLARLTGSPIIPVFVTRTTSGRFATRMFPAIDPGVGRGKPTENDPAIVAIAKAIETMVAEYPTQWLNLRFAFDNDTGYVKGSNVCRNDE